MYSFIIDNGKSSIDLFSDRDMYYTKAEGLGKEIVVNVTQFGARDGGVYNSSSAPKRVITVYFTFYRHGDTAGGKKRINSLLPYHKPVTLTIKSDAYEVYIKGYCESLNIDNSVYPMTGTAVIVCPDPFFKSLKDKKVIVYGNTPMFKWLAEGITVNRVIYGNTAKKQIADIMYEGDVESGLTISITANAVCTGFKIENITTDEFMTFKTDLIEGDKMIISTHEGEKTVKVIRYGEVYNWLKYLTADSTFFKLADGQNIIRFTAEGITPAGADVTAEYNTLIGGI